jgi:L-threonylcarbamoyladenylate synthase
MIHAESLQAVLAGFDPQTANAGTAETAEKPDGPLRSPGRLPKHYSPKAKLEIRSWAGPDDLQAQLQGQKSNLEKIHVIAHTIIPAAGKFGRVSVIPHDAEAFARALYAELHECDEMGADLIIVETLPETNEWHAIADRLMRAAH